VQAHRSSGLAGMGDREGSGWSLGCVLSAVSARPNL
jgi:hypothetical protein